MANKTALFTNFTKDEFTGYWDGKAKKFAPGQSLYLPDYLARHFAKHLTNQELLRTDKDGNLLHKNGDKFTSPKRPSDTPMFMKLFNKAYIPPKDEIEEEISDGSKGDLESVIESTNKNIEAEEDKVEEEEFKGAPKEPSNNL